MFITIAEEITSEIVEKKSKFIANMYYVESRQQAEEKIKEIKKRYYDARHNCLAYRIMENGNIIEKSSDDGEPSGTAGAPMLNLLQKGNLCNVLVIVTRYFGGILLGTGGLVRAYSEVTAKAIEESKKVEVVLGKEYQISVDYSSSESFKYYCKKNDINIINVQYSNEILYNLEIENEFIDIFLSDIDKRTLNILGYKYICEKYIRKNVEEK